MGHTETADTSRGKNFGVFKILVLISDRGEMSRPGVRSTAIYPRNLDQGPKSRTKDWLASFRSRPRIFLVHFFFIFSWFFHALFLVFFIPFFRQFFREKNRCLNRVFRPFFWRFFGDFSAIQNWSQNWSHFRKLHFSHCIFVQAGHGNLYAAVPNYVA